MVVIKVIISVFISVTFINFAQAVEATMPEATGVQPDGTMVPAALEEVGQDVDGKEWTGQSKVAFQRIDGYELDCEPQGDKVGMCGCGAGQGGKTSGMKVSKGFAKVLNNSISKCVQKACGDENGSVAGSKIYACGFQDRKTAGGKISNHASANAGDISKIVCGNGREITADLTGGKGKKGNKGNKRLVAAIHKTPDRKTRSSKNAGIPSCSHATPPDGYQEFVDCWAEVLDQFCPPGQGGALTAANTPGSPPRATPDKKRCHHNDHIHFSSCPGKGK